MSRSLGQAAQIMARWRADAPTAFAMIDCDDGRSKPDVAGDHVACGPAPESLNDESAPVEGWFKTLRTQHHEAGRRQLTPSMGRTYMQELRPDLQRINSHGSRKLPDLDGPSKPSRMPGNPPIFVGNALHAANVAMLRSLGIRAVLNAAPVVCRDPVALYDFNGITYCELDCRDDAKCDIVGKFLEPASAFIKQAHARGDGVLVHCMAGINRSATLVVGYLMLRDELNLFHLFDACLKARPTIIQNPHFQLQLCTLAHTHGLLYDVSDEVDEDAVCELPARTAAVDAAARGSRSDGMSDGMLQR